MFSHFNAFYRGFSLLCACSMFLYKHHQMLLFTADDRDFAKVFTSLEATIYVHISDRVEFVT